MNTESKPAARKIKLARNKPARNAMFLVTKKEEHTLNGEFPDDFQDLYSLAMDRAIGIEKASLTGIVELHSSVIDIYKSAFWFAPVFGAFLDRAAKSFADCIELQMNWLDVMVPQPSEDSKALLPVAAPRSKVAASSGKKRQYKKRARAMAA